MTLLRLDVSLSSPTQAVNVNAYFGAGGPQTPSAGRRGAMPLLRAMDYGRSDDTAAWRHHIANPCADRAGASRAAAAAACRRCGRSHVLLPAWCPCAAAPGDALDALGLAAAAVKRLVGVDWCATPAWEGPMLITVGRWVRPPHPAPG